MLKLTITDIHEQQTLTHEGSKQELLAFLQAHHEEAQGAETLEEAAQVLNDSGFYAVKVEPVGQLPYGDHNLLPEDYLTHEESDDPWVREADIK